MMEGTASGFVGILYAEDFDDPQLPPPEPAPSSPGFMAPSFTADQLDAARQIACAEAVEAARDEWESSALHGRTRSLAAIASLLADAQQEAGALADTVADGVARTILSMLAGLLPDLCARHGGAEVRALLRHLLPTLAQQPRIAVRVNSAVLDGVRGDLALLDEDLAACVVLTAAPLLPGDARVTWTDGSLVRDQGAICAAVAAVLTELGLLEPAAARNDRRSKAFAE